MSASELVKREDEIGIIKHIIALHLKRSLFELNDDDTRYEAQFAISRSLSDIKSDLELYDWDVVCDASNNSDNNVLNVDVFIRFENIYNDLLKISASINQKEILFT